MDKMKDIVLLKVLPPAIFYEGRMGIVRVRAKVVQETLERKTSTVKWFGAKGDYNVLVMSVLGPSLEDLFSSCNRKLSLKTVVMLADQMLGLSAGFGPQFKKQDTEDLYHDDNESHSGEDVISTQRNGSATVKSDAFMKEREGTVIVSSLSTAWHLEQLYVYRLLDLIQDRRWNWYRYGASAAKQSSVAADVRKSQRWPGALFQLHRFEK
ncbi:hypothetical protein QYE76_008607 [Lolium multiflorum]|uniref:Uncharacterized protein n=1 Tax=Lolium multiflorum TaxID=4521 RepID=A0AAD8X116_LOLMU|nr:hypothetical protein QYE76_008607 [Lolium multiflorum]